MDKPFQPSLSPFDRKVVDQRVGWNAGAIKKIMGYKDGVDNFIHLTEDMWNKLGFNDLRRPISDEIDIDALYCPTSVRGSKRILIHHQKIPFPYVWIGTVGQYNAVFLEDLCDWNNINYQEIMGKLEEMRERYETVD